jgi:uncharacterized membrane protein (UPF0127 family)
MQSLGVGSGIWIAPCEAVHTFGMKISLDVFFLNREFQVKKIACHVPPMRVAICLSAHSVLELPAGAAQHSGTRAGDQLHFRESAMAEENEVESR